MKIMWNLALFILAPAIINASIQPDPETDSTDQCACTKKDKKDQIK